MMTCDVSRDATILAAYGELDAARLLELKAHLRTCADCAERAREVQGARELIATAEGHAMPAPWAPAAPTSTQASRPTPTPTSPGSASWLNRAVPFAAAAAILIMAVVATVNWRQSRDVLPQSGPLRASGSLAGQAVVLGASAPRATIANDTGTATEDAYLGSDGFGDEIDSLQSELSTLESKVGEF